jgi:hypothetical protein
MRDSQSNRKPDQDPKPLSFANQCKTGKKKSSEETQESHQLGETASVGELQLLKCECKDSVLLQILPNWLAESAVRVWFVRVIKVR